MPSVWRCPELEQRKPKLLFASDGLSSLRCDARRLAASLLKLPPRLTRLEPLRQRTVLLACSVVRARLV